MGFSHDGRSVSPEASRPQGLSKRGRCMPAPQPSADKIDKFSLVSTTIKSYMMYTLHVSGPKNTRRGRQDTDSITAWLGRKKKISTGEMRKAS